VGSTRRSAPFSPHLFTFHADHTFLSANPDAGDPNTSDSDGEGVWEGRDHVRGMFKEYNADRTTHQFVSILTVTYTITISGDTFSGDATATVTDPDGGVQPCHIHRHTLETGLALAKRMFLCDARKIDAP
jgi:hypothetical protein